MANLNAYGTAVSISHSGYQMNYVQKKVGCNGPQVGYLADLLFTFCNV